MSLMFRMAVGGTISLLTLSSFGVNPAPAPLIDPCLSSVSASPGIVMVCPAGDGDPLSSVGATITVIVELYGGGAFPGIHAREMWLVGCNDGLLLCGGSAGSNADGPTDALGVSTFSNEPIAGGCDTGLYVSVFGYVIQQAGNCQPHCLSIATRSPDYKSAGAPGPAPCPGDIPCPDLRVTVADFSWFASHYPSESNPGAPYLACADLAAPFSSVSLADLSKFVVHFAGAGHQCSS